MIDENNYLTHSEAVPGMMQVRIGQPISAVLKDGYAFRPGLASAAALALLATKQAKLDEQRTRILLDALQVAEATLKRPVDADRYTRAISDLRKAIRSVDVPVARHRALNWFPRHTDW